MGGGLDDQAQIQRELARAAQQRAAEQRAAAERAAREQAAKQGK